jgi:hypothetical protein
MAHLHQVLHFRRPRNHLSIRSDFNFPAVTPEPVTGPVSLRPSDCPLFGHLKKHLADKRFATGAEMK